MKRRKPNISAEERARTKGYRDKIRAWRQHPDDPWAELERLELTEAVGQLGWSQPRVTREMNKVASEEKFRLKVHRALQDEGDRPLHLAAGVGHPGTPEEDHGYTRDASHSLDPEAEIIDLPTLERIRQESETRRCSDAEELLMAMESVRDAVDQAVRAKPGLMREVGREIWQMRGRVDAARAKLKRKLAA